MKSLRARFCIVLGLILIFGLSALLMSLRRSTLNVKDWLCVSGASLATQTNPGRMNPTISFNLSNRSPRSVHFSMYWFECRSRNNLALITNGEGTAPEVRLPGKGRITMTLDLPKNTPPKEDYLFCCKLHWREDEPMLWHMGRKLEPWVSKTLFVFNTQAVPP